MKLSDNSDFNTIMEANSNSKALKALHGSINPLTNQPFSKNYYDILEIRKKLPVYQFIAELEETLSNNQVIVCEGETGIKSLMKNVYFIELNQINI